MKIVRDTEFLRQWKIDHAWCAFCGIGHTKASEERWPGLEVAHIIGASGRSDEPCNVLTLCSREHSLEHCGDMWNGALYQRLTEGHLLWVKFHRDRDNWNPERLTVLKGKRLEDLIEPPAFLQIEWAKRGRRCI